ncbi:hypothetical protein LPB86_06705 [Pedobacter sp. MC2016-14]|uniref:hypothetical protein n=1 Tax=Pedobacter sp. MC2016-14 TaxID=2897327 RepID=UPI001E36B301|nr:hypothetical protein [Pedobacter sp. MC2016-14]MCD0487911.1 hypothetical protein [Pedobacter sp. MC2016-14]
MRMISLKQPFNAWYRLKKLLAQVFKIPQPWFLFGILLLLFTMSEKLIGLTDPSAGLPLKLTWLFMMQGLIAFSIILLLCWYLMQQFWMLLGLPALNSLIVHFDKLKLCQKLGFYFALFALLVLASVGCLIAIC